MNDPYVHLDLEQAAEAAFNKQAPLFDQIYAGNTIVHYKRERVRSHVLGFLQPASEILELNAGTGEDAIFFAGLQHHVHATDISEMMQERLREKVAGSGLQHFVSTEKRSFTDLAGLENRGPYDLVFSNFAGLNCTGQLDRVLDSLAPLVKPGGLVTLVLLPKFCLWEFLLLFRGKFRTAFRRFAGKKGASAHIEGEYFRCWYYNPRFVRRQLKADFRVVGLEGLCSFVPPSYIEQFAEKRPRWFGWLKSCEEKWKSSWPWRSIGDYYLITLQKNS